MSIYTLRTPTGWASPPDTWSYSSLASVDQCPRRWQFLQSQWGDYPRYPTRAHPAAIEGTIVHEALDRLTRACGRLGNPALGSPGFAIALQESRFYDFFAEAIADWQTRLNAHPRPGPVFRLRSNPQELANVAVRLFRQQYKATNDAVATVYDHPSAASSNLLSLLQSKGALSEIRLRHPTLAFQGVLDRVQGVADGIEIIDFKTGTPGEAHRQQLLLYALLWWRCSGQTPARITAQYLQGGQTWIIDEATLVETENALHTRITSSTATLSQTPAPCRPGPHCNQCPVRAHCDEGWLNISSKKSSSRTDDVQVVIESEPQAHGFRAIRSDARPLSVVYEAGVGNDLPQLTRGATIRILDGAWRKPDDELEIKPWTQVFLLACKQ
jgi:hypothetical protein